MQAQILDLLRDIAHEQNTAIIMITHDLGVVAQLCERVNIMYAGQIVERGTLDEIFYEPHHPYTSGLLQSVCTHGAAGRQGLSSIPGTPPDLLKLNTGCAFMPRCAQAMKICKDYMPVPHEFSAQPLQCVLERLPGGRRPGGGGSCGAAKRGVKHGEKNERDETGGEHPARKKVFPCRTPSVQAV